MPMQPTMFDESVALDIREMWRQWVAYGRKFEKAGRVPGAAQAAAPSPINQLVRVSSTTPDSYGYPCYVQFWDGTAWSDAANQARAITPLVDTLSQSAISPGAQTVTPDSMIGISVGQSLLVDPETANSETVNVTGVEASTFDAAFAHSHSAAPVKIQANGKLQQTTYKARLIRVEGNGLFIYAVAAADASAANAGSASGGCCSDPLAGRVTTCDIVRPFGNSSILHSNVACTFHGDDPRGRGSGVSGLLVWTAYMDVSSSIDILDGVSRVGGSNTLLYTDGDEVRIPHGASSPKYVVVWVEQWDDGAGTGTLIKRVYLMRDTA